MELAALRERLEEERKEREEGVGRERELEKVVEEVRVFISREFFVTRACRKGMSGR